MLRRLHKAIELRTQGNYSSSKEIFTDLISEYPTNGTVFYHYAWLCDNMGRETEACSYYEKALELGLTGAELKGCYLGLGSTYRCLGEYEKSIHLFTKAIEAFPENNAYKVFKAMTLYNVGKHQESMHLLLKVLAETSSDQEIQNYKKAIVYYADKLDKTFKE